MLIHFISFQEDFISDYDTHAQQDASIIPIDWIVKKELLRAITVDWCKVYIITVKLTIFRRTAFCFRTILSP